MTNHDRVGKAMELLRQGLGPFVDREMENTFGTRAHDAALRLVGDDKHLAKLRPGEWDAAAQLKLMWEGWNEVFRKILGPAERSFVNELRDVRNRWAHQRNFSSDDAYRALDTAGRLLAAVSAPQSDDVEKLKTELLRVRFDEQMRGERRKSSGTAIESQPRGSLTPWREVVSPHPDVASGRYQQAEFAADLWQVHLGKGSDEYRDPCEFFRRTYLTESLTGLLANAAERLTGHGGDPVVQLQTNFGGGKTHSMLALYHLFSGASPSELPGVDAVMTKAGVESFPKVNRVVLVGNKISPGNPATKSDGTVVRTLWGELAWQLGGKKAFARIAADDERATSPGDALRELMEEYGPCLILIDEWVAYARQLHDAADLPAGSFETQFSFAQVLTESAKLAKQCLLVISLPASDTSGSPHAQAEDVEVGGERGRAALDRLRNAVGRVEASWRPATAEEGFEIVRRRLFEPLVEKQGYVARDTVAREFYDLYRTQHQEFPRECRDADYEKRMRAAYPIHPEVFDRLYTDWSTLVKFQRTRGVLRLMAAVIHSLWESGDRNPLILPANIPLDDGRVQSELTRYLSDNWLPVIGKDVDGPQSLPRRIDAEVPNLGRFSACLRVARTIYLGSAPTVTAANRGIEDRRVKLGCVMPGETPAVFGDALRRLAGAATYLYADGPRYWYSTQPTVTKLAEDRAEDLKRDPDKVQQELDRRVRANLRNTGDFDRVHPLPQSGQDVPDDLDARLVVLSPDHCYSKEPGNPAEAAAMALLESRGNAPRLYRNTLVFLAPDRARLHDLEDAARRYLAWDSIVGGAEELELSPHQVKQAETQRNAVDGMVTARIPETYQWLLVPEQSTAQGPLVWQVMRLTGSDALAVRASKKLRNDDRLVPVLSATVLRKYLEDVPLWRGDSVTLRQLVDDFGRYTYLPRLLGPEVLSKAIRDGLASLTWQLETFAYAESYDEAKNRYLGLKAGQQMHVTAEDPGLLVRPDVARAQMEADEARRSGGIVTPRGVEVVPPKPGGAGDIFIGQTSERPPHRFFGTVVLDSTRAGRDAGRIADEVISHLVGLVGAKVRVTMEVAAEVPDGVPPNVVRIVTENARTLKFENQGFEEE